MAPLSLFTSYWNRHRFPLRDAGEGGLANLEDRPVSFSHGTSQPVRKGLMQHLMSGKGAAS